MPSEIIFVVEEAPEGGYVAHGLGASIVTEADTLGELREMIRDAVRCHFETEAERPAVIRLHLVHDEVIPA
jgi:predicted RNase H-like HicB family nuclease